MDDMEFVQAALWGNILKAAKVNILTGEYTFLKTMEDEKQLGCLEADNIGDYLKLIVKNGLLHPDDAYEYLYHTDLTYLRHQIETNRKRIVYSFRRKSGQGYFWMTFEIVVPESYSHENPWVVFDWKTADTESRAMEDSIKMLSSIFHKILRIDLTHDTHEEIKVYDDEMTKDHGLSPKISEWFSGFATSGNVYEEDREGYLAFTNIDTLKKRFKLSKECIRHRYRRLTNGKFRWVMMELLPSIEYTDDNQIIMLYIRDIHDDYVKDLQYQKDLEYYCNTDVMTGMPNRYYYERLCEKYAKMENKTSLGVLFADVNALKYVNDHYGHERGDEHIKQFASLLTETFKDGICCRISGDEFIALIMDIPEADFMTRMDEFHAFLQKDRPIASIGYAWTDNPETIEELTVSAEQQMYVDKDDFYKRYPEYAR